MTLQINFLRKMVFAILIFASINANAQNKGGDNCIQAYRLPVSLTPDCELGVLKNENTSIANPSSLNPPCDNAGVNKDLWYSFIAPSNGEIIFNITLGSAIRIEAAVYKKCNSVSSSNTVFCTSDNANGKVVNGLIPGKEYFLQVWSDEFAVGVFDICLTGTAIMNMNDACNMATPLVVGSSTSPCDVAKSGVYNEDNFGATANMMMPIPSCGSFGEGRDVWFSFVVPNNGEIFIELSDAGGPKDWTMSLYTGDCQNLSEVACDDDSGPGLFPAISKSGLTPGSTVLLRVWEYGGDAFGHFNISLFDPTPINPINDFCADAVELTVVAGEVDCKYYRTCGYNINATTSGESPLPSCSEFGVGIDTWYKFQVPNNVDEVVIDLIQQTFLGSQDWAMSAYSGVCGNLSELACDDDGGDGLFPSIDLTGLNAGDWILIRVWDYASNENGSYNVCASFSSVLAVVFQELDAAENGSKNIVEWTLSEEYDTDIHELESCASTNFGNWITIGSVLPQEKTENVIKYKFVDNSPSLVTYYRVKITNNDGSTDFSKVVSVIRQEARLSNNELTIHPNPVKDQLIVSFNKIINKDNMIVFDIMDVDGRILINGQQNLTSGQKSITVDVSPLNSGSMFIINVTSNGKTTQRKFVK